MASPSRPRSRSTVTDSGIGHRVAACGCCGTALRALREGPRGNREHTATATDSATAHGPRSTVNGLGHRASGRSLRLLRDGPAGLREGPRGNREHTATATDSATAHGQRSTVNGLGHRASGLWRRVAACGCCGTALRALREGPRGNREHTATATDSATAHGQRSTDSGIGHRAAACGCCGTALRAFREGPRGNREHTATATDSATANGHGPKTSNIPACLLYFFYLSGR